jgi:hypothetical protein
MGLTRGNVIDRVASILGDDSSKMRVYLTTSINTSMLILWDMHDWSFKHKSGSFNTVNGTESYNLRTSTPDIRSADDVEVMYDFTNGTYLRKVNLHSIRKQYPKEDTSGKPSMYAPFGVSNVYLSDEPDGAYTIKYLYLAKATLPSTDADDLETVCGLPDYIQPLFEKIMLSEGMLFDDDSRRNGLLAEIKSVWLPSAIQADMKQPEQVARFKFWHEELLPQTFSYNDYLKRIFSSNGY